MRAYRVLLCTVLVVVAGCGGSESIPAPPAGANAAPWQRTEEREPCANFDALRAPYFGDLHIHTFFSADAYLFGTRAGPRDAYRFARGEAISASDDNEAQTRSVQIDRPLDFAAVTDHSEFIGEVQLCTTPGSLVYDNEMCQLLRQAEAPEDRGVATVRWLYPAGVPEPPPSHEFCFLPGVDCDASAVSVWQEMQAAAEAAYDRSDACSFTTFIGYEHTASPIGRHMHRNVIFRNHHVPPVPASQLETFQDGIPQGVWTAIERDCLNAGEGCDAVIIPHNSNLSGGMQFTDPADGAEAQRRQDREPLVEIYQQKGNSECRFDRLAAFGAQTEDELCTFEQLRNAHEGPDEGPPPIERYPARNMVRNALKEGLRFEETHGANPFQYGFVGSTDTHNATGGNTDEDMWEGAQGNSDASPARQISSNIRENPGGLAVVWAEENSRDALFAALRRRETYATSGTRPIVRFYGGGLTGIDCDNAAFVANAYKRGAPMGGEIGSVRGDASPRFAVFATKDAGTDARPGTDLQRIQIVKGWVDAAGQTHERVFDVAGDANNGAGVDPQTCAPVGAGARELCAVWEDPDFNRAERSFYYARVLENPRCRWSTLVCKNAGVDPFASDCAAQASRAGNEAFADCCMTKDDDSYFEPVIQERAWTSPIYYRPESIAGVRGGVDFGVQPGADVLDLTISIGRLPAALDLEHSDMTVKLTDNDEIYNATFTAGTMQPQAAGRFALADDAAQALGLRTATFEIGAGGEGLLHLQTIPSDLAAADRVDHMVRLELQIGAYRASHTRMWEARARRLAPVEE